MTADRAAVASALASIEAEMRRLGYWNVQRPTDEQITNGGAFGTNSMAFVQWLRWVFVPKVHELLDTGAPLPASSSVGAQAAREWGFSPDSVDTSTLEHLLSEFDRLF
jgi:uncharacterized protein YqcC (DUF446 family)